MRPPAGVHLTPRPDRSDAGELIVEISIDTSAFDEAMRDVTEQLARFGGTTIDMAERAVASVLNAWATNGTPSVPPDSGWLQQSIPVRPGETYWLDSWVWDPGRVGSYYGSLLPAGSSTDEALVSTDAAPFDLDPDRCWKCDAKPGMDELDGTCWHCWYDLTGSAKAPAGP